MNNFSQERLMGIKLQHLVRESFRIPLTFQDGLFQYSMLPTMNFHEFLRNFLAINILYGCLRKVEDSSQTLSRLSVYKVYYILCHKLTRTHSNSSNCVSMPRRHFLGQPRIGGLTKLIYPDLVCKRLGRRGDSKVHYIGWTWNESTVDKDTLGLLDLHVTDLSEYFKRGTNPLKPSLLPRSRGPQRSQGITNQQITPITMQSSPFKPLLSFVDFSCKYPNWDCSPRLWKSTPNVVPKQSEWAKVTTERSLEILKEHGVNLGPLITKLNTRNFADDDTSIIRTVIQPLKVLWNVSASKETYLHFYLAVILLLFPAIVASDREVPKVSKAQLRASLKDCVMTLEKEVVTITSIDKGSLTFFSQNLRKMIHISEMTSCAVNRSDTKSVFKEILSDFNQITNKDAGLRGMSACEELFISGAVKGMNAFSPNMSESSFVPSHTSNITNILNIGKTFQNVSLSAMSNLVSLSSCTQGGMAAKDVPYQVFHLSARVFHQMTLTYPEISHLPIRIISFIISYFFNEMQRVSFSDFAKRDPDLSQETFKFWWIYSSMFQEYMDVMSEVVSLSQSLV
ncbi:hypothetical protein JCM33374_g1981 [Metschnikowia sp. JCM 33374]|nr:hypothetical protein JCM33374_g1981 [Metschnikowia sp. JCM 33374]